MAEKELPSHSDDSDEDFVPEANSSSEADLTSANSDENSEAEDGPSRSRKRRKVSKKKKKKEVEEASEENEQIFQKVTDVEALWADFKQDVNKMEKQIVSNQEKIGDKESDGRTKEKPEGDNNSSKTSNVSKKKIIQSNTNSTRLGLNKVLNQIGRKEKMSTLAKSQLDWNNFKKNEGIEEEIKMYNRGKDGYLEKQDFLQRTDLRQFEIEKQLRASKRNF